MPVAHEYHCRSLSGIATLWMHLDPSRAYQILADLRQPGRPDFVHGISQIAPCAANLRGAALALQLVEAPDAAGGPLRSSDRGSAPSTRREDCIPPESNRIKRSFP
jgi:hypothetical protein